MTGKLGGPQSKSGRFTENKNIVFLQGIEPRMFILWSSRYSDGARLKHLRCFRKIAKDDYYLLHICLSVCRQGKTRLPLDGLS